MSSPIKLSNYVGLFSERSHQTIKMYFLCWAFAAVTSVIIVIIVILLWVAVKTLNCGIVDKKCNYDFTDGKRFFRGVTEYIRPYVTFENVLT